MNAEEFDKQFDDDIDISHALDLSQAKRVMQTARQRRFPNLDDRVVRPRSGTAGCYPTVHHQDVAG